MKPFKLTALSLLLVGCSTLSAKTSKGEELLDGKTLQPVQLQQIARLARPGSVIVIGENHGHPPHHANQRRLLQALALEQPRVSVGMEFFERPDQSKVDSYLEGKMPESDFLKSIQWGKPSFDHYREQVLFPKSHGGWTVALNAPRALTGKVAKNGIAQLPPEERAQLPSGFELGNEGYRERFRQTMIGHAPESEIQKYFEAQSIWDEVMASSAVQYLREQPEQVLVIIVGDFHAAFGGGLPDRLRARGAKDVIIVSQINARELTEKQLREELEVHPKWGARADFIWVTY